MTKGVSRKTVFTKTNGKCAYCGGDLDPFDFHREHAIPQSRGGPGRERNMVASCNLCNARKRTKTVVEFRDHIRDYPMGQLQNIRNHLAKYAPCLPDNETVLGQIETKMRELDGLFAQLKPQFYMDNLDINLFLDGDLGRNHG